MPSEGPARSRAQIRGDCAGWGRRRRSGSGFDPGEPRPRALPACHARWDVSAQRGCAVGRSPSRMSRPPLCFAVRTSPAVAVFMGARRWRRNARRPGRRAACSLQTALRRPCGPIREWVQGHSTLRAEGRIAYRSTWRCASERTDPRRCSAPPRPRRVNAQGLSTQPGRNLRLRPHATPPHFATRKSAIRTARGSISGRTTQRSQLGAFWPATSSAVVQTCLSKAASRGSVCPAGAARASGPRSGSRARVCKAPKRPLTVRGSL